MCRSHSLHAVYYTVGHKHGSSAHIKYPARSDLFYWWFNAIMTQVIDHRLVNWNLLARLSITIHQHPSSYNIRMCWCKCIWSPYSFLQSLKNDTNTGSHSCLVGVTTALGANVREWWRGVIHSSETGVSLKCYPMKIIQDKRGCWVG